MVKYRVTNMTKMSISIEDLGLMLHRSGNGMYSSCIISEYQYLSSADLKTYRSRLKIERIFEPQLKPLIVAPEPIPSIPSIPSIPESKVESGTERKAEFPSNDPLHEVMKEVSQKLSQVAELLARSPSHTYVHGQIPNVMTLISPPEASEPYVPGIILPKDIESHISIKEAQTDDVDFQSSAETLRKMRKK